MSVYARLSEHDVLELSADVGIFGKKLMSGYLNLVRYLHRFGSVPSGESALASILNVTTRYLREVAWPLLEDRLVMSEDGKRYFDPDISAVRPRRAGTPVVAEKSKQHQKAAFTRHARARAEAEAHAERMKSDAQTHAESMRGASETHAETDANASPDASLDASGASPRALASPPPLKQDSLFQPVRKKESSGGGGTRAPASDDAPADARPHARTHKNDAQPHAEADAQGVRPIRPSARPIPPDWKPNDETLAEAGRLGVAVDAELAKFILTARGDGHTAADWDARFLVWCHRQVEWAKRHPQAEAPIVIPGGKAAEPEPDDEPITGTGPDAEWARATRKLKAEIGAGVYRNWLAKAVVVGIEDGEVTISLPTAFIRDYVRSHYLDRLTTFWQAENSGIIRVQAIVAAVERRTADG